MKKYYFVLVLAILFMFIGTGNLLAADDIKVYVNGNQVVFPDQKPMINADSRTLVPVRFVSEALGADVEWDGTTNTVSIAHEGKAIGLVIGQRTAQVDAGSVVLDTAAALVGGRTMVPLRFVSECLGAEVQWDQYARAIYIITLEKPITAFVGKSMTEETLKTHTGKTLFEPGAQFMYVTTEQLPIKFGNTTIFNITPGLEYIAVKQSTSNRNAAQMLIIQGGISVGARTDQVHVANPFTASYDTQSLTAEALGVPKVDINKVDAFAFRTYYGSNADMYVLIVENPLNKGGWRP